LMLRDLVGTIVIFSLERKKSRISGQVLRNENVKSVPNESTFYV
jgi:hypothetical protein